MAIARGGKDASKLYGGLLDTSKSIHSRYTRTLNKISTEGEIPWTDVVNVYTDTNKALVYIQQLVDLDVSARDAVRDEARRRTGDSTYNLDLNVVNFRAAITNVNNEIDNAAIVDGDGYLLVQQIVRHIPVSGAVSVTTRTFSATALSTFTGLLQAGIDQTVE